MKEKACCDRDTLFRIKKVAPINLRVLVTVETIHEAEVASLHTVDAMITTGAKTYQT